MIFLAFVQLLVGGWVAYLQITSYYEKADLQMEFFYPREIAYKLKNHSRVVAESPFRFFMLFDLDSPGTPPIPVPAEETSYIRGGMGVGPNELMGKYGIKDHRYFGVAQVFCKNCEKVRTYVLNFTHGKDGGWFIEQKGEGKVRLPQLNQAGVKQVADNLDKYLDANYPQSERVLIQA